MYRDLGRTEKERVKLSIAYDAPWKTEYITETEDKRWPLKKATKDKEKAEEDLEVYHKSSNLVKVTKIMPLKLKMFITLMQNGKTGRG